jgi:hypothetical protein
MAQCSDCGGQLGRFKANGGHMANCPQLAGKTKPSAKPTKDEKAVHKSHVWSNWTAWICLKEAKGTDFRSRRCLDASCRALETETRKCRH